MAELAVIVPVLNRPHRVEPTAVAFLNTTPSCEIYFVCDAFDEAEIEAVEACDRANLLLYDGSYPVKINHGVGKTTEPLIFLGADDLEPQPGWFETAREVIEADPLVGVVGVNDLLERDRSHATHFLVTRAYAELPTIDGRRGPLCEQYQHWYCDDEMIATARYRGAYAYAPDSHVKHLHPMDGSAPYDETYAKGSAGAFMDRRTFRRRSFQWT